METVLSSLAFDSLRRLQGAAAPEGKPQLLAWFQGKALLRAADGLREVPEAEVPSNLDLSPLIDHTILRADAKKSDIESICQEARRFNFASVCVNPVWVPLCASRLQSCSVNVCTVVGFPLGANESRIKAEEARIAFAEGAREIDMVLALGLAKSGDWEAVRKDMRAVRQAAPKALVKVILETCLLTNEEKRLVCKLAVEEGLDFVKTSTGFSTGGATENDVRLMREAVGASAGVKASGGVRTYSEALRMIQAGATRLGLSTSLVIVEGGEAVPSEY